MITYRSYVQLGQQSFLGFDVLKYVNPSKIHYKSGEIPASDFLYRLTIYALLLKGLTEFLHIPQNNEHGVGFKSYVQVVFKDENMQDELLCKYTRRLAIDNCGIWEYFGTEQAGYAIPNIDMFMYL